MYDMLSALLRVLGVNGALHYRQLLYTAYHKLNITIANANVLVLVIVKSQMEIISPNIRLRDAA